VPEAAGRGGAVWVGCGVFSVILPYSCLLNRKEEDVTRIPLTRPVLDRLAGRFRALGEPNRLAMLAALRRGERTVTELIEETGLGQANVSKHLHLLHAAGFLARRREGLNVLYRLQDDDVFQLCDILCGRLEREARAWGELLEAGVLQTGRARKSTERARTRGSRGAGTMER
jgi:DNA-binding transcriptional ArsR family regulator